MILTRPLTTNYNPLDCSPSTAKRGRVGVCCAWDAEPHLPVGQHLPSEWDHSRHVGQYGAGASPFWALDMAGNDWEWVNDWYQPDYYTTSPVDNPTGPTLGEMRVLRGGGYTQLDLSGSDEYRTTYRLARKPDLIDPAVGFRCALAVRQ